ncbi:MAG: cysteine synthase family protein [bacterium]|nr:cysteine synthase family protein [bacterium]
MKEKSWNALSHYCENILEAVGGTPLVRLNRITRFFRPTIYAKIEWYSPTGSLKDRIYGNMISKAEARGDLRPGMAIIECSSGNAGIACSAAAAVRGYACTIVMPEDMGEERKKMIRAYGAELILTPGGESDVDIALQRVKELYESDPEKYWFPGEFENPDNTEAHYQTSGPEIWEQLEGKVDAIVAATGTGGWLTGVGRYLKEKNPDILIYGVEPTECPLISEGICGPHGIAGIGDGLIPKILDLGLFSGMVTVSTEESIQVARRLSLEEGIFCGISSGCNMAAAMKFAQVHAEVENIVTVFGDSGQRYFSTALCNEETLRQAEALRRHNADWEIIH